MVVIRVVMDLRQQRSKSHFRHSGQGGLDSTLPQHSCPTSRRGARVRVTVRRVTGLRHLNFGLSDEQFQMLTEVVSESPVVYGGLML